MPDERVTSATAGWGAWAAGAETVWLPTAEEMGHLDREAVASGATTERTLIEAAGREIARRVQAHWPEGPVVAVAGRGHNGADALVALRTLHAWGRDVRAVLASAAPPDPDVLIGWDIPLGTPDDLPGICAGASVIMDGVLGTGVKGAPREPQASLIETLNRIGIPVAAVDGPSGADFSSGAVAGACVRASLTVSLGWPNVGLLRHPAREYCGRIECVEIGFPPPSGPLGVRAITGRWVGRTLIDRGLTAHKGRAGYLALLAGQSGMAGAAVLGGRAALRGGVGILKVVGDPANREIVQRTCPGAIYVSWESLEDVSRAVQWSRALAIGPGLGRSDGCRQLVEGVLDSRGSRPVVVDADGLSVFAGDIDRLAGLVRASDVVTPHPGELALLTGAPLESVLSDPPGAAIAAAETLGCAVLLKGAPSWIAETGQPLRASTTGGPAVASGGTGDVVTGLIGSYLAAGMAGADAAAAALWLTGAAAASSPEPAGHLASDIPDRLPGIRARLAKMGPPRGPVIFVSEL